MKSSQSFLVEKSTGICRIFGESVRKYHESQNFAGINFWSTLSFSFWKNRGISQNVLSNALRKSYFEIVLSMCTLVFAGSSRSLSRPAVANVWFRRPSWKKSAVSSFFLFPFSFFLFFFRARGWGASDSWGEQKAVLISYLGVPDKMIVMQAIDRNSFLALRESSTVDVQEEVYRHVHADFQTVLEIWWT